MRIVLFAIIFGISFPTIATAQGVSDLSACRDVDIDFNPDQIIDACTTIIESWHGPDAALAVTLTTRGNAYYDKGLSDRAIQDYDQAVRLDPDYAEAFYGRGSACFQKQNYDCAIHAYNEAIRLKPDFSDAYNNRSMIYYNRGELDHALKDLDKAIALKPKSAMAVFNRAYVYSFVGNCFGAMQDFALAKALNPKFDVPENLDAICTGQPQQ